MNNQLMERVTPASAVGREYWRPIVFIISAPSGSGKSTLVGGILSRDSGLSFSVSYTTRPPRLSERPGHSYIYTTREDFLERIARDEFLEHAEVFGNYYGTSREVLDNARRQGKDLILDIDVQGARQLKQRIPEAVSIFVLPPSREVLEQRLRSRSEDSEEVIQRRLREAGEEIRKYQQYDYLLVNREVEASLAILSSIVKAERVRRIRMEHEIRPILDSFDSRP